MLPNFGYVKAHSVKAAVDQLSSADVRILAGGTDLLGCLREHIFTANKLVSISRIQDLAGVDKSSDGGVRIGALTTITGVAENPVIKKRYPVLAQAASEVASPQLRNQGTIGGNICQKPRCWYYRGEFHCRRKGGEECFAFDGENQFHAIFGSDGTCCMVHPSDTAPALIALGAAAQVVGRSGEKLVPLEKFFVRPGENVQKETVLKPDEIVTEILLPKPDQGLLSSYRKVRARRSWDFSLAGVALALTFKGDRIQKARVVLSGAAPVPWRSKPIEDAITGRKLDAETITKAAEASVKGAEPLERNGYKTALFKGVIQEELEAMAAP